MLKYHDSEIAVIQTAIDENTNEKYKFELCSITKLKEDGSFHYDGTNLKSFMGNELPNLKPYEIELKNRTTQVLACKEENGVFCTGRKCNTRLQGNIVFYAQVKLSSEFQRVSTKYKMIVLPIKGRALDLNLFEKKSRITSMILLNIKVNYTKTGFNVFN